MFRRDVPEVTKLTHNSAKNRSPPSCLLQALASFLCGLPTETRGSDSSRTYTQKWVAKGPVPCTEGQVILFINFNIYGGNNQTTNYMFSIEKLKEKKIHSSSHLSEIIFWHISL